MQTFVKSGDNKVKLPTEFIWFYNTRDYFSDSQGCATLLSGLFF